MVSCNLVHMFGSSLMFLRIQERLEGAKASARKIAVFNAMRYRNYRFYWLGQLSSVLAQNMEIVAQSWLVLQLTSSPLMLGLTRLTHAIPTIALHRSRQPGLHDNDQQHFAAKPPRFLKGSSDEHLRAYLRPDAYGGNHLRDDRRIRWGASGRRDRRYHGAGHGLFGGRIPASGTPTGAMNMTTKTRPQGAVEKSRQAFLPQP